MVQSNYTDPTQATVHLIILLVSTILESGTGNNNFVKGKGHFGLTDQNNRSGQSGSFSMVVLDIPVRPNQNGLFHLIFNQNFQNFGLNGKLPMLKVPWLNVWGFSDRVLFLCQYFAYLAWTSLQTTSFAWFDWAAFRSKDIALKKRRKGTTKRCSQSLDYQHYSPFAHLVCSPKLSHEHYL